MTLAAIQGQSHAIDALTAALRSRSVHHAYLFEGPEGVGKELAALGLGQALMCLEKPQEGCGVCSICVRVAKRSHPDMLWLMPEEALIERKLAGRGDFARTPSRDIRVDQVRALQERLALRPLEAEQKLVIVVEAQKLNEKAQNAFLKTLEEPPSNTIIVLLSSASDKLLPTIKSRTSRVRFGPLPAELIAKHLVSAKKMDAALAPKLAVLAEGSLARASELDPDELEERSALIRDFENLSPTSPTTWIRFAEQYAGSREDAEQAFEVLATWTRDVLVVGTGSDRVLHMDLLELAKESAKKHRISELHQRFGLIEEAKVHISSRHNAAARLQMERLLILSQGARS
jgi:DNA polymerase-3 subunit delta'